MLPNTGGFNGGIFFLRSIFFNTKNQLMQNNEELILVLNDLVRINNDRMEGYIKALEETDPDNGDLLPVFRDFIEQSRNYKQALQHEVIHAGGKPVDAEATGGGKIYRQ